jgi:hypothetical protein
VKLFPNPANQKPDAKPGSTGEHTGRGHVKKEVPQAPREIAGVELLGKPLPCKRGGSQKAKQKSAIGREVLDGCAAQLVILGENTASRAVVTCVRIYARGEAVS